MINYSFPGITVFFFSKDISTIKYYTIIDFNQVDIRIYLPEKVNITLRVDKSLCLPKLKSLTVLLYDFSIIYVKFYFHFYNKNCIAKVIPTTFNNCFLKYFMNYFAF